jgi:cell division protease FtsH
VLDPALLRPGRFDRQVTVGLPDVKGREQILRVHMRRVPLADDVEAMTIARGTPGFSGADLANLVNEAALFAARENAKDVRMEHFDRARDKILMGTERRSMAMSEQEKTLTAYHEAGHAIVGRLMPEHDPVYKVTDHPARPRAGRHDVPAGRRQVLVQPHRHRIDAVLAVRWPRRRGTHLRQRQGHHRRQQRHRARDQDGAQHGDQVGPVGRTRPDRLRRGRGRGVPGPFGHAAQERLGRHRAQDRRVVHGILDKAYNRTKAILTENIDKLHVMAKTLLEYETIDVPQIDAIMEGREPPPPAGWARTPKGDVRPLPPIGGPAAQTYVRRAAMTAVNRERLR